MDDNRLEGLLGSTAAGAVLPLPAPCSVCHVLLCFTQRHLSPHNGQWTNLKGVLLIQPVTETEILIDERDESRCSYARNSAFAPPPSPPSGLDE